MPQLDEMIERFDRLVESLEAMADRYETAAEEARELADAYPDDDEKGNDYLASLNVGDELRQILMHA